MPGSMCCWPSLGLEILQLTFKSWKVEGGVPMLLPLPFYSNRKRTKTYYFFFLRLGFGKFLPLLDTSHHGWHLSKVSPSTAKAGTVSTPPLAVEGNGLQQRSGAGRLPLQCCKAPCKIWKRLSKPAKKLTRIGISHNLATFQSEGQKQSDSSVYFCLTLFRLFALLACTGWSLFGSSCVASAILSSVMDHGGSMWLAPQGAMIWVTFPNISSKHSQPFTAQVAKIPSCHCRIASDQAMLAKSMALSWRTDLFTPSPKVFRKRGWSIDIEAKHHLSVSQFKRFKHPCSELLTYIKHHETYILWKKNMHFTAAFHFISFHFVWVQQPHAKKQKTVLTLPFHFTETPGC